MTRIRCTDCRHYPGHGNRCTIRQTVRANRHWRQCDHFETPAGATCGDCHHRGGTGTCYPWTNQQRRLILVDETREACMKYEAKRKWGRHRQEVRQQHIAVEIIQNLRISN